MIVVYSRRWLSRNEDELLSGTEFASSQSLKAGGVSPVYFHGNWKLLMLSSVFSPALSLLLYPIPRKANGTKDE